MVCAVDIPMCTPVVVWSLKKVVDLFPHKRRRWPTGKDGRRSYFRDDQEI
jgi:hypothetical protein